MTMSGVKKKRVSKRNKISWRKHVNITDVEEFLEEQRLEERLGPPLATLSNDELFTVDTKPSEELSTKEKRKLKLLQPPRCFAILQPHTNVPDPIKKRNRVRSKEERKNDIIKKKEALNRARGILKHKEQQAMRDHKVYEERKQRAPKTDDFVKDIWVDEEKLAENNIWFNKDTIRHNLVGTGRIRKTVKNLVKPKASILPTVEPPHPGMSYNPSYEDHQDLLKVVAEKEAEVIKQEKHLTRVTTGMFSKVTTERRDASWLQEMSEGLPQLPHEDNEVGSDGEYKAINPPTKNKKKTLQQRRKQKEQVKLALARKTDKVQKKKVADIHQLRLLDKQIQKRDTRVAKLREKRERREALKKKETKRLSAMKFEESELEFNMGVDIAGNLRNMKTEGNLLSDRFKSLQKRNIIEPTIRRHKKRPKVKVYTKPGHKEDWIKTVAR